jgi:AcrR family transcriptional regulator
MGINERKEKQKVELKRLILEASMKLFVEEGFENVTFRRIAEIIEYSPTTIYLHFKDKNEILFNLCEQGFSKMGEYNANLLTIQNPLLRLHKMGENYIKFGMSHPEYYDVMFIQKAPMETLNLLHDDEWKSGHLALERLQSIIEECMQHQLIAEGEVVAVSMGIWGMVHGLVSLAIRDRFEKLVAPEEVINTMHKALNWMVGTMDLSIRK